MQKKACEQFAKFEFSWNSQNYSRKLDACMPAKSWILNCFTFTKKSHSYSASILNWMLSLSLCTCTTTQPGFPPLQMRHHLSFKTKLFTSNGVLSMDFSQLVYTHHRWNNSFEFLQSLPWKLQGVENCGQDSKDRQN